ncbi:hypothetical protein L0337_22005 [candidate division KSB1 bacterium]|nr:hypothetical protein [candidate division KSB1 bacterium]
MENTITFDEVLEAADKLSLAEQETLLDILHRRTIARRRIELAKEVEEAQREFQEGRCRRATPEEIVAEILS